ncbi:MAG: DUF1343 domain-containing protein [Halobacteriovoraceae bacterium]|nr:DUF1343 domain-containing protein [Halobacteriovoraceae bacterium]
MNSVKSGLDHFHQLKAEKYPGNIGLLCHAASVDSNLEHAIKVFDKKFGNRLTKIFSPQHGLVGDVQDNMVESPHFDHPYFKRPVYSLYSETRIPTAEMLNDIDIVFVDLQDVGCRIYTYIYSMALMLESCATKGIKLVVLDRPNPINGVDLEGNILDTNFKSFVGLYPLPIRHGMTIGEIAHFVNAYSCEQKCDLEIISMIGWKRKMSFEETKLPWVLPSPNLATVQAAYTFPGTVLFEGTNISEGRGTTISLEIIGHPKIEPYSFLEEIEPSIKELSGGFILRPLIFLPTFQKHHGKACGGFQIHVTDRSVFEPWKLGQVLCRELYHHLGSDFSWKEPPYEYIYDKHPIDVINGTDQLRLWVEKRGSLAELKKIESSQWEDFNVQRNQSLLY